MDGHGGDYALNPRGPFPGRPAACHGALQGSSCPSSWPRRGRSRRHCRRSAWSHMLAAFVPSGLQRLRAATWRRQPFARAGGADQPELRPPHAAGQAQTDVATLCAEPDQPTRQPAARPAPCTELGVLAGTLSRPIRDLEFHPAFPRQAGGRVGVSDSRGLYFRGGRPHWLARTALADVLPPEFQTRSWRNTPRIPDLLEMAAAHQPRMLAEITRLQGIPRVAAYFDFARMRRMVVQRPGDSRNPWSASRVRRGMRALIWALHVEWLVRDNTYPRRRTPRPSRARVRVSS